MHKIKTRSKSLYMHYFRQYELIYQIHPMSIGQYYFLACLLIQNQLLSAPFNVCVYVWIAEWRYRL